MTAGGTPHDQALYDLLAPLADRLILIGLGTACSGAVAPTLAELARPLGRSADARRHGAQALELAERMDSPPMLAYARHAAEDAAGALELARELGMERLAARVQRL